MKKSIRAILSVVFVLVLGATMLVACNKDKGEETPETHTYSQTWSYDSSEHWHQCTLDGHTDVADKAEHTYDNDADTTCNVCGYVRAAHTHAASAEWSKDATNHWHECTVSGCGEQFDKAEHTYDNDADTTCNVCGYERPAHTHQASTEWLNDETNHWHLCTVDGCAEKLDTAAHVYDNDADTTCNVCGYERAVVPTVKTYTITFVTNGGSPVAQIEAEAGDEITVPAAPTKSGERFVGWYESTDGGTTLKPDAFVFGYMPSKNITLYAKWQDAVIGSWETYQVVIPAETEGDEDTVFVLGDKCNFPQPNTTLEQNTYHLTVSDTNISLAMLGGAMNGSGTYTKTDGVYNADVAVAYGGGTETFKTQTTYDAAHDRLLCNIVYYEDETSTLYYTLILTRVNGEA